MCVCVCVCLGGGGVVFSNALKLHGGTLTSPGNVQQTKV